MDSPQYLGLCTEYQKYFGNSFKPYYKWIVLNTLIILSVVKLSLMSCFKPYYKWIVLNTPWFEKEYWFYDVLIQFLVGSNN